MSPLCMMIGIYLTCSATGPMEGIQLLLPSMPTPDSYITPVVPSAAPTTRQRDIVDEMIAAHLRAEREGRR